MKNSLVLALLLLAHFSFAQKAQTYLNDRGQKHLAGPFELNELRTDAEYKDWYEENAKLFSLKGLPTNWKKNLENTQVDIFLGTWCGDSKRWVPQFVKMWKDLGLKEEQLNFTALYSGDEKYKQGPNREEKGLRIHRVPTFIFKEKGEEYARIVEYPRNDLEQDLAQIAVGYASEPNYRAATYLLELFEKESMVDILKDVRTHLNEVNHLVGKDRELNTLGYVFLYSNRTQQALLTFQFNTIIHPHSPRAFNSYGEALLSNEDKAGAIRAFKRVIELDLKHENANRRLQELESDAKGK